MRRLGDDAAHTRAQRSVPGSAGAARPMRPLWACMPKYHGLPFLDCSMAFILARLARSRHADHPGILETLHDWTGSQLLHTFNSRRGRRTLALC